jgi:cytochrome c biogenesis protein CcdA
MVILFFTLSLLVASAQEQVLRAMRAETLRIRRWGGMVLIGMGAWLLALAIWGQALVDILPV